ncbi:MAG: hypothetical protein M1269_13880 [Chloroflexi bacterium]|nr:hypothetical protein [Chloroflexota bacterium]
MVDIEIRDCKISTDENCWVLNRRKGENEKPLREMSKNSTNKNGGRTGI